MNPAYTPEFISLSQAYSTSAQTSRQAMIQMLNIIREQDRAMRDAVRDAERAYSRAGRSRLASPAMQPSQAIPPPLHEPTQSSYTIPYAPPHIPGWEPNHEPPRHRPSLVPEQELNSLGVNLDPPPFDLTRERLLVDTSFPSAAQRLQRYREISGRIEPRLSERSSFRGPDTHVGAWTHRRSVLDRYPSFADLSPVRLRPTLREMAIATREACFGELDNPINTQCPITLRSFSAGDIVLQIRQCRHVFAADSLRQWFETNVRCPVCRHDVREPLDISGTAPPQQGFHPTTDASTSPVTGGEISITRTTAESYDGNNPITSIVSDRLRGTDIETDVAARSIMQYISDDIRNRVREHGDLSGNVMIEYGFTVPHGATGPSMTNIQVRDITTEDIDDLVNHD